MKLLCQLLVAGVLAFASLSLTGCSGDGIERCAVEGNVTFNGEPVANGELRFIPDDPEAPGGTTGSPIVNGKYSVTHNGGVPVGSHTVRIEARTVDSSDPNLEGVPDIIGGTEFQYLPEQYNSESTLKVEVTGEENPQIENFDLEKN